MCIYYEKKRSVSHRYASILSSLTSRQGTAVVVAVTNHCVSMMVPVVCAKLQLWQGVVVPTLDALVSGALDASLGIGLYAPTSSMSKATWTAVS